jgi:putative aldouronate transport system permease protein
LPTIIVMFLMRLGRFLDVSFEQVLLMTNDYVTPVSEIFDTYAYRVGVQNGNYSVGAAVGFFKSVVSLILVLVSNWAIKKTGNEGMF